MQTMDFGRIANIFKNVMKQKDLNYNDLALQLKMSESGVKKLLTGKDCSLSKILKICDVLEIPAEKVFAQAAEVKSQPTPLTSEQRKLLNSDEETLRVLTCLQMVDCDLRMACKGLNLKKEAIYPHLRKLDEVKLIEWNKGDQIKSFAKMYYDFKGIPASQRMGDRLRKRLLQKAIQPGVETSAKWACRTIRTNPIRPELLEEMNSKITKLIEDYMWLNAREWEIYPKKDMIRVGWVFASFPYELEEAFRKD